MVFKKIIECVTVFVVFAFKAQSKDLGNGSDSSSVVFDLVLIPPPHIKAVTAIKWQNQRSMYKITIELGNNVPIIQAIGDKPPTTTRHIWY